MSFKSAHTVSEAFYSNYTQNNYLQWRKHLVAIQVIINFMNLNFKNAEMGRLVPGFFWSK